MTEFGSQTVDGPIPIDELDRRSIDHVLTTTRAVRRRLDLDRPVPLEVIDECLEIALQAPTGFNMQQWRWLVITDADTRRALADLYRRSFDPFMEMMEQQLPEDDEQSHRVAGSSRYLGEHLEEVPVHVIPCTIEPVGSVFELWNSMGYETDLWNMAAAAVYGELWPAAWSFMLALRSRGLGSSLTMIHLGAEPEARDLLDIPDDVSQAGLIPVAFFEGEDFKRGARRPVEEVTYYDRWNRSTSLD